MKVNGRFSVVACAIALGVSFGIGGCTQNPNNALVAGGVTYTEADITELQSEIAAQGQPLSRTQAIEALGYFGAVGAALDDAGIISPDELQQLGEELLPDQSKGLQINQALSTIVNQFAAEDPEGAQALLGGLQPGTFAPGTELNPRYGSIVEGARNPNLADVVSNDQPAEGLG